MKRAMKQENLTKLESQLLLVASLYGSVLVDLLFVLLPIGSGGSVFGVVLLCITLCPFSFAIILKKKRELVSLLFIV